ncbi:MAG: GMC family oxidoreductase [Thermoleophilaceae bacterium]|nr:GMC family oxidoreductase [Thermoleophilaceae bacterium]
MAPGFDVIVVGSGFGGAVTACRLAQAGASVLVLERGRRWTKDQYPRGPGDAWLYQPGHPHRYNGWLDLRFARGMTVAQGAGVGGGSLCYSSVVMKADPALFEGGWPPEITYSELAPYYAKVHEMLAVREIPPGQHTHRYKLLQRAAERLGHTDRFDSVPLALSFDPEWSYELPDPLDTRHSRSFVNGQGQPQGTCVHLGNCDIGCDVQAKNTLDLNYIPAAEQHGAEVRPLHLVRCIQPDDSGYRVIFDRIEDGGLLRGEERAERVVVAAGSLGSTELLLRCRDQHRTLPRISGVLGRHWSANANFFTSGIYGPDTEVGQSIGPTIAAGLDFMDGSVNGQRFFVEDDGFPNLLLNALTAQLRSGRVSPFAWALQRHLRRGRDEKNPTRNVMVWLGEGVDAADGELSLGRRRLMPWKRKLRLTWDVRRSAPVIDAILSTHQRLTEATGGHLRVPLSWSVLRSLVTVHPLGGCRVGTGPEEAVVDHRGEVFGHRNLFVADGAIVPVAIGRNPSMTIGALAERTAALMTQGRGLSETEPL